MCQNKTWETRWYALSDNTDHCSFGQPLGSCADPYLAYHEEDRHCVTCLLRYNQESPSPPRNPETYHPDDHDHSQPELMHYEASEQHTLRTTGELTMPMRVARELNAHGGTTIFEAMVPEHGLMPSIAEIMANRNITAQDPIRQNNPSDTTASVDDTDVTMGEDDIAVDAPATPARPITPSQVTGDVFQGPIPDTALNNTPLPTYNQAVTGGQAPIYDEIDPDNIPLNRRTLARVASYATGMELAYVSVLKTRFEALYKNASNATEPSPRMRNIAETVELLRSAWNQLSDEAKRRDRILFEHDTTSATQLEAFDWIDEITRNPPNSVKHISRRFSRWLNLLETEYSNTVSTDGTSSPSRREINLAFERQETRDQMAMQGDEWTGSADDWMPVTEQDKKIFYENMISTRWFPAFYSVNDRDDEDYDDDVYPIIKSTTGHVVQTPEAWGVPTPSGFDTAGDMMEID